MPLAMDMIRSQILIKASPEEVLDHLLRAASAFVASRSILPATHGVFAMPPKVVHTRDAGVSRSLDCFKTSLPTISVPLFMV